MSIVPFNTETGAIEEGYTVQSPLQKAAAKKHFRETAAKEEGRKEGFIFNVMENLPFVASTLTSAQCGYLLVLSTYITYEGLIATVGSGGNAMSQSRMLKALSLRDSQRSTLTDFLTVCIEHGIMRKDSDGYYITNGFHTKGTPPDSRVVRSYITKLREMARENKPEQLGFIYKLLPSIHKTTNILCANPNELTKSKVVKLGRPELSKLAGVNVSYVSRATTTMMYKGNSVFAKITTAKDGTFYMLNPSIFRRADRANYDETTKVIFGID